MKKGITSNIKLWLVITVAILTLGVVLFAFFGFNQSVDYKDSYEAVISVDDFDIANAEVVQLEVEKYFDSLGYKYVKNAEQVVESSLGYQLIYKFNKDVNIDTTELKNVVAALYDSSYNMVVEAEYHNVVVNKVSQAGWVVLALAIATAVTFLYVLIFEKAKGALTMIANAVLGAFVYLALVATARIPANAFLGFATCFAFGLSAILSSGMINRFREEIRINESKNENSQKLTYAQIADKAAQASMFRFIMILTACIVVALAFIIAGTLAVKVLGLHILVVAVASVFTAFVGTPVIWSLLKDCKKK